MQPTISEDKAKFAALVGIVTLMMHERWGHSPTVLEKKRLLILDRFTKDNPLVDPNLQLVHDMVDELFTIVATRGQSVLAPETPPKKRR